MQYNMYFDVYAIVIVLFEIAYLLIRKNRRDESNRLFLALLIICGLTAIADMVSAELIMNSSYYSVESMYIWNSAYLFMHQSIAFLMVQYILLLIGKRKEMKPGENLLVSAPFLITAVLIFSNPVTHFLFYFDEKHLYRHSAAFVLLYVNVFYYLALGVIYTIRHRKEISKKIYTFLIVFVLLGGGPVVLQIIFPDLLVELFFESIGMLLILLAIDNDDELLHVIFHSGKEQKEKLPNGWLFAPRPVNLLMIVCGVVINLIGRHFAGTYSLPFWLDTVGTLIVAIQLGPVAGALTGLMFNMTMGLISPESFWYLFVNAGVGFAVGFFYPRGKKRDTFLVVATSVIAGVVAVVLSTPINMLFYDGYTANVWGDGLYDMLAQDIHVPLICSILGEAFVDMPDKAVSMLLAIGIVYLAENIGKRKENKVAAVLLPLVLPVLLAALPGKIVNAEHEENVPDYAYGYETVTYNTSDGLVTAEINVLAQTPDGYIWAGSYSGLYRYDGVKFEEMAPDARITNVTALYVDTAGKLWIGTNDHGVACYDNVSGELVFYTMEDGLPTDSIRSLSEDGSGNMYVGTSGALARIAQDGKITSYEDWEDISYIRSLTCGENGTIAGVTNGGILFFVRGSLLLSTESYGAGNGAYTAVTAAKNGNFYAGSNLATVRQLQFDTNRSTVVAEYSTGKLSYYNDLYYDEEGSGVFLCAENGMGYLTGMGQMTELTREGFSSSISDCIRDYQGNIWFASNKQGIAKLTRSPFINVLSKAGIDPVVVNCLKEKDGILYVGTDEGLKAVNLGTYSQMSYPGAEKIGAARVRHILQDSKGDLWISTYGEIGLAVIGNDGSFRNYTEEDGTMGGRFRSALELNDGTVVVASNTGLSYFVNGVVIHTIGERDGLTTPQILSMVQKEDGSILAASDGDGIYVIRDGKVVDRIGEEDGLESLVVLRIVPYEDGFFYVTSNALYYDNGSFVRQLINFPYHNNYDIYVTPDGEAWISSSAGIYILDVDSLAMDIRYSYTLLNRSRGLTTTLTANAWNYVQGSRLYLCCSDGVRMVDTENYDRLDEDFAITLSRVSADDKEADCKDGIYQIPAETARIRMQVAVLNYTLSNPRVKLFLEGAGDDGIICRQSELTALSYTNLPYGSYNLHVQILDENDDTVLREEVFLLYKDARIFERTYFKIYLLLVCAVFLTYFVWLISKLGSMTLIHRQYEAIRAAKVEAEEANRAKTRFLANMSHEIRTPINAVMGLDELILRDNLSPSVRRHAQDIRRASVSLLDIVNDILDLSRIESGKLKLVNGRFDLAKLISDVSTMIRVRCESKGLNFHVSADAKIPRFLSGDEVRLRQILINLLGNAAKYTERGYVDFFLELAEKTEDKATIRVRVEDSGIGIRQEDIDKLYEPYERIDEAHHKSIQGTGLGLNITKQLLELMGSRMEVSSTYGKGSCFSFDLSLRIAGNELLGENWQNVIVGEEISAGSFTAPDARILIVDDNEMNLYVTEGLLKRTGIQLTLAESGKQCLECCMAERFDLILLDHMMPNMDGIETLKRLRSRGDRTPAIALTANALEGARDEYLAAGFVDYLSKPITGEMLEAAILKYLPEEKIRQNSQAGSDITLSEKKTKGTDTPETTRILYHLPEDTTECMLELAERLQLCYDKNNFGLVTEVLLKIKETSLKDGDAEKIAALSARLYESMKDEGKDEIPEECEKLTLECIRLHKERNAKKTFSLERKTEKKTIPVVPSERKEEAVKERDAESTEQEPVGKGESAVSEIEVSDRLKTTDVAAKEGSRMELKERLAAFGVDMGAGLRYCANEEEFYRQVLKKFANGFEAKSAEIEQFYKEKNWAEYAVKVHALKGNARTIGATEFAERAYELELAGKASEEAKINEKTEALLKEYGQIAAKINEALSEE